MTTTQLPAYLQKLSSLPQASFGFEQPPRLSIKDNRFRLIDAAGNERLMGQMDQGTQQQPGVGLYLDVNIFNANEHMSKQYRPADEGFDPDNPTPPTCWSDNGVGPSAQAMQPQHAQCVNCPKNEIGSAISKVSGERMKACRDIWKMAMLVPGIDTVFQFVLTPGSFKNWRQYEKSLKGHGYEVVYVATRLFFVGQGVLGFKPVSVIDEPTANLIDQLQRSEAADFACGRGDKPRTEALPQPAQHTPLPAPPLAPGPVATPAASLPPGPQAGDPGPGASTLPTTQTRRGRPPKAAEPRPNEVVILPGSIPPQTFAQQQQRAVENSSDPFAKMYPAQNAAVTQQAGMAFGAPQQSPTSFGVQPNPLPPPEELRAAIDAAMNLNVS